ncbi:MAG: FMN-binding protein [candidate division WOR-3 bacterium]
MILLIISKIYLTNEQALKLAFGNCESVKVFNLILSNDIKSVLKTKKLPLPLSDELNFHFGCDKVVLIDNVIGKHLPITFMVVLNKENGKIEFVEILAYREPYGEEIRNKAFLSQFHNKNINDSLRVNKEIRNIAGATISVNSITYAIKRTLFLYENYVKDKIK